MTEGEKSEKAWQRDRRENDRERQTEGDKREKE